MRTVRIIIYALTVGIVLYFLFFYSSRFSSRKTNLDTLKSGEEIFLEGKRNIEQTIERSREKLDSLPFDSSELLYNKARSARGFKN